MGPRLRGDDICGAGTTSVVGAISAKTSRLYSAALAVLPNIRVGVAKPQVVPSVILT
jgi:hypothetical protein